MSELRVRLLLRWRSWFWRQGDVLRYQRCPHCGLQRGRFTAGHGGPLCLLDGTRRKISGRIG